MTEEQTPFTEYNELEITLPNDNKFLCVAETLTRIGIAGVKENTLYQSCHVLYKREKYYIKHFKEMMLLDGKRNTIEKGDIERRNRIAMLLDQWGLISVVDKGIKNEMSPMSYLKVVSFKEKANWTLIAKYKMLTYRD